MMTSTRRAPALTLSCCRCGRQLPRSQDAYVLDDEWARRYPDMTGRIACYRCSIGTEWTCTVKGAFVPGHIPAQLPSGHDIDSWSHIPATGTLKGIAVEHPEYAIAQGGREYIGWAVARLGGNPDAADLPAEMRACQEQAAQRRQERLHRRLNH
jgi:hypothetical protein